MLRFKVLQLVLFLLLPVVAAAGPSPEELHREMAALYARAQAGYGVAIGERGDPADPVNGQLRTSLADLLCLRGDASGCLAASREAGRPLGPYAEPLVLKGGLPDLVPVRAFLTELHQSSEGLGKDQAVASECLALIDQVAGDALRARLVDQAKRENRAALQGPPEVPTKPSPEILDGLLKASERLALALDQTGQAEVARRLLMVLEQAGAPALDLAPVLERLQVALHRGRSALQILGENEAADRVQARLEALQAKALTPPGLDFELVPEADRFTGDLGSVAGALRALAGLAPLRSRPSVLLLYASATAGTIAGLPGSGESFREILETLELSDPYLAGRARGQLGRAALLSGDYQRSEQELQRASRGLEGQPRSAGLRGRMEGLRAQAQFYLGQYAQAAETYPIAARLLQGESEAVFKAWLGSAQALMFAGRVGDAAESLRRAEALLSGLPEAGRRAHSRSLRLDRALLALLSNQRQAAQPLLEEVAREAVQDSDVRAGAIAETNLAELCNDSGEARQALVHAENALRWLDPLAGQADAVWQALTEKGRSLTALGEKAEAERALRRAVELVETLRARIGAEGSRRSFAEAKTRLYRALVALLAGQGQQAEAFQISERARGRAFLDMLGEREIQLGNRRAQERLAPARKRMLAALPPLALAFAEPDPPLAGAPKPAGPSGPAAGLSAPAGEWGALATVEPAGLQDVQQALRPREALISLFHDGQNLYQFVVDRRGLTAHAVEVSETELYSAVDSFRRLVQEPQRGLEKVQAKGLRLYRWLLADGLTGRDFQRVVIVPCGSLHAVPFLALWDGKGYLADRLEVSVAPSASALVMLRKRAAPAGNRMLVLGNPATDLPDLPEAAAEAKLVGRMFPASSVRLGREASKEAFLQGAPRKQLIHVASHGVFQPESPMDSYLALAAEPPERGRLTAMEILGVDLTAARLVVLSACGSGQAEVIKGDELLGLSRAFLHAGAGALLASLWSVSDQGTRLLLDGFYRASRAGAGPAAALRKAIRTVRADPRFAHPFFWAAFEAIGG